MRRSVLSVLLTLLVPAAAACGGGETTIETPPQTAAETSPTAASPAPATKDAQAQKPSAYPATAKRPVVHEYHGVKVTDDYEWLEPSDKPEVKAWIAEQNARARAYFDSAPARKPLIERVKGIISANSADHVGLEKAGDKLLAIKFDPKKQQPFLVVLKSADATDGERTLVDPNVLDKNARTTIDWYEASPDGKLVAVSLSEGGTENGTVHVWEVESGKKLDDVVTFAHSGTAGGSLAWTKDGKGFHYTRHPHPGERPEADMGFYQQVYFHKIGTKESEDKYAFGKELPKIAEIRLETSPDGKWMLASVQNGDGGEYWHYLMDAKGKWARIADIPDKIVEGDFGLDNKLYLRSLKDAPRGKIVRITPDKPDLAKAQVLVPQGKNSIMGYTVAKSRLYITELAGGPSEVRVFDLEGKETGKLPILPVSSVGGVVRTDGDDLLFRNGSYTEPSAWYKYASKDGKVQKTKLAMTSPVSFDDAEVVREMCTSKDGTKVPINILRKKGMPLDGKAPALLSGYGGYSSSQTPGFGPLRRLLLDQGGVVAIANLRGGGEFGEEWHLAGNLTKKQNVFDDFYACAKHLVDTKHTSPSRLAIMGGSNGGLLMGAALTQHPEMYRAVVSAVGIYDMLREELTPNGLFNTTEFGSVKNPEQFKALYAYSPLHNVKDGTAYPAVLFTTGANDPRVDPYHSRKMTARLQAATTGGVVLLRASEGTGHGAGTPLDEQIEQIADVYAFLFKELGIEFKPGK
ncbi:prolyl oligopeptidase family serine peptidase [Polyangium aurulentum]|uniref:prolyl oligopeptidase family serine peptidase n=1 Tax=Polyangium aurulentum TaxID=2567896 RepID=UPI0010AE5D23|nr:prolyl oligopeptidase family serine peptidase [Polyangium aurulentum]UQA62857.1 prolyl oligopeptidase family serine peptidase [Polyangium aurulentum]